MHIVGPPELLDALTDDATVDAAEVVAADDTVVDAVLVTLAPPTPGAPPLPAAPPPPVDALAVEEAGPEPPACAPPAPGPLDVDELGPLAPFEVDDDAARQPSARSDAATISPRA